MWEKKAISPLKEWEVAHPAEGKNKKYIFERMLCYL